ncbi:MAG: hypothetical protein EOP06_11180, partial [Proteobacteria bacterium]
MAANLTVIPKSYHTSKPHTEWSDTESFTAKMEFYSEQGMEGQYMLMFFIDKEELPKVKSAVDEKEFWHGILVPKTHST